MTAGRLGKYLRMQPFQTLGCTTWQQQDFAAGTTTTRDAHAVAGNNE
jgi:hypothetical protein